MKFARHVLAVITISIINNSMEASIGPVGGTSTALTSVSSSLPRAAQAIRRIDPQMVTNYVTGAKEVFEKVHRGVKWFNRMRSILKNKKSVLSSANSKARHANLLSEIEQCLPDDPKHRCYSRCERNGENFQWCFISSEHRDSQWDYCQCSLRSEVVDFLELKKQEFLAPQTKPWTDTEIALIATVGVLSLVFVAAIIAFGIHIRRNQADDVIFPNNVGQFVPNPLYQAAADGN